MRKENVLKTLELLGIADGLILNLVLSEESTSVKNVPRKGSAKVNDLVHHEEKKAGSKKVVVHPAVVRSPKVLELGDETVAVGKGKVDKKVCRFRDGRVHDDDDKGKGEGELGERRRKKERKKILIIKSEVKDIYI